MNALNKLIEVTPAFIEGEIARELGLNIIDDCPYTYSHPSDPQNRRYRDWKAGWASRDMDILSDNGNGSPKLEPALDLLKQRLERYVSLMTRAFLDLERIMPEFEPSGDREDSGWQTLQELAEALGEKS